MELKLFCPRWGSEHLSWDNFFLKVKEAGYDGVEYGIAREVSCKELENIVEKATRYGLLLIAQHYDTYEADFDLHKEKYKEWFDKIKPFPFYKINSQTGKDFFSKLQNLEVIDIAENFSSVTGRLVYHETHRNKFAFAAHVTKEFLKEVPELQLTLDISHWVNVAESWLEDQEEAVELAISRTGHVHARVGYQEGPQIPDPRIELWQEALSRHLTWWDRVAHHKLKQKAEFTITAEFGPYPYMVSVPSTGQPISDQWAVNVYMMELLRKRYQN